MENKSESNGKQIESKQRLTKNQIKIKATSTKGTETILYQHKITEK